jgi:hypothetical protein
MKSARNTELASISVEESREPIYGSYMSAKERTIRLGLDALLLF